MARSSLVAAATVAIAGAMLLGSAGASAHKSLHTCGPAKGTTVRAGRTTRVYALPGTESTSAERFFGCLAVTGRSWRLEPSKWHCPYRDCLWVTVEADLIAVHAPWVAYPETFHGRDTSELAIAAKNLRTGQTTYCGVGARQGAPKNAPEVTGVVLKRNGHIAWIGERRVKSTAPTDGPQYLPPGTTVPQEYMPYMREKQVVACGSAGEEVLGSGVQINLQSLFLHGSTLTWTDGGETRTAVLQ